MSNPIPSDGVKTPSDYITKAGSVNSRFLDLFRREPDRLHSYRTIAEDIGTTTASVQVRLSQLRRRKRIEKLLSIRGQGGGSQYRVLDPGAVAVMSAKTTTIQVSSGPVDVFPNDGGTITICQDCDRLGEQIATVARGDLPALIAALQIAAE